MHDRSGREDALLSDGYHHIRIDVEEGSLEGEGPCSFVFGCRASLRPNAAFYGCAGSSMSAAGSASRDRSSRPSRVARWIAMLRVHDAVNRGASQREIASVPFGAERMEAIGSTPPGRCAHESNGLAAVLARWPERQSLAASPSELLMRCYRPGSGRRLRGAPRQNSGTFSEQKRKSGFRPFVISTPTSHFERNDVEASPPSPPAPNQIELWARLTERSSYWRSDWRERIDTPPSQDPLCPLRREQGLSNETVFEAFAVALTSGNARWDRIARIRSQLHEAFQDFSPAGYAALSDSEISETLVPWFRQRGAGSAGLDMRLANLRQTAAVLAGLGAHHSARNYLEAAFAAAGGSSESLAMLIGSSPAWKLPGFGIPLAAEALRLLGFDLCKPDRHVLRAIASWHYVQFARWERKGEFTAPQARPPELLATMLAVRAFAEANGLGVSYANSVIWIAGAASGPHLTNLELERLARPANL